MRGSYVAVSGNIGSGKSSLISLLSAELGWKPYLELEEEHPFLADFYRDKNKWGFHTQMHFLSRQLLQQSEISQTEVSLCQDRNMWEGYEVFIKELHDDGVLDDREFDIYSSIIESVSFCLRRPDVLVYLRASVPTLMKRIRGRGRDYESGITEEYLSSLNQRYEAWVNSIDEYPIVTIDVDQTDWENDPDTLEEIVNLIQTQIP